MIYGPGVYSEVMDFVRFPSTFWTTIAGRPERARAEVFLRYRGPISAFIRNQGVKDENDVDDLVQEVFIRVCQSEFLKKADRTKGRFRSLLLGVTRHVLAHARDRKRVRDAKSIEQGGRENGVLEIPADQPSDEHFDRYWKEHIFRLARERLQKEQGAKGPRYYDALVLCDLTGLSYREAGVKLSVPESTITNWIHQARKQVKEYAQELAREYSSSEGEFRDELTLLDTPAP